MAQACGLVHVLPRLSGGAEVLVPAFVSWILEAPVHLALGYVLSVFLFPLWCSSEQNVNIDSVVARSHQVWRFCPLLQLAEGC